MTNDITGIGQAKAAAIPATLAGAPSPTAAPQAAAQVPTPNPAAALEASKPEFEPTVSPEQMRENLREAIQKLNDMMRESSRDLNFSMDETTDRVVITVKNSSTGEVVRQIPDATLLRMATHLENLKGVLHNETT